MVNPFEVKEETYWSRSWAGTIKVPTVSGLPAVAFVPASETEPFNEFDIDPANVAVFHLGNNGTAREELKSFTF